MRSSDVATLSGLQMMTEQHKNFDDEYLSTDDRELSAWRESVASQHGVGEVVYDDADIEALRSIL